MKNLQKYKRDTRLLKFITMFVFILLPFVGFYLGMRYQRMTSPIVKASRTENRITKEQAADIVKNLPEIKGFLKMVEDGGSKWFVDVLDGENNTWSVQVYELVEDLNATDEELRGHTNTFNWYRVEKNTGKIVWSMFSFDSKGNLKR